MIDAGTPPGDILILTQSKAFGAPLYEALTNRAIPVKSYYAETELNSQIAQLSFAILKLLANHEDRVALRWLIGLNGNNWNAAGYRRVREHCENAGISPWEALSQLSTGIISLPYTNPIVAEFNDLRQALEELEALPDLQSIIDKLFPEDEAATRDMRELSLSVLETLEDDHDLGTFTRELSTAISHNCRRLC